MSTSPISGTAIGALHLYLATEKCEQVRHDAARDLAACPFRDVHKRLVPSPELTKPFGRAFDD
jgi:hypothetical protein